MTAKALKNYIADAVRAACSTEHIEGNTLQVLHDGPATFAATLKAISEAQHSICIENFKFLSDVTGWEFANALAARARDGLAVYVLYDAVGSLASTSDMWRFLEASGAQVRVFRPLTDGPTRAIVRDHRKLTLIDGCIGFVGGVCIGDEWAGRIPGEPVWRDTHTRVEGPICNELQCMFFDMWEDAGGPVPEKDDVRFYPSLKPVGDVMLTAIGCDDERSIRSAYLALIENARHYLWITNAYFYPDADIVQALRASAERGVEVRIIVPSRSDIDVIIPATRSTYESLLDAGVEIYEYQPAVLHAKTALADGCWATIGSCNLDSLSLLTNYELNLAITDEEVVQQMERAFQHDLRSSERIDLRRWRRRPALQRFKEFAGSLLGPRL